MNEIIMDNILLGDIEGAFFYVEKKILDGWILAIGDIEILKELEYSIYTPGTPKNNDFELISLSGSKFIMPIALLKKNDKLHDALDHKGNFDYLVFLEFADKEVDRYNCIFTTYKGSKKGFEPFVRERLHYVFSNIDKLMNLGIYEISVGEVWDKLNTKKIAKKKRKS